MHKGATVVTATRTVLHLIRADTVAVLGGATTTLHRHTCLRQGFLNLLLTGVVGTQMDTGLLFAWVLMIQEIFGVILLL